MAQGGEASGELRRLAACQHRQHLGRRALEILRLARHQQQRCHVGGDGGVVGRGATPFQNGGGDGAVLFRLTALNGADRVGLEAKVSRG